MQILIGAVYLVVTQRADRDLVVWGIRSTPIERDDVVFVDRYVRSVYRAVHV
jgi:hypothetical protein